MASMIEVYVELVIREGQEIQEIKSIPYTPTSHPFIERLIGTIRR
jgi:hypothetical protein